MGDPYPRSNALATTNGGTINPSHPLSVEIRGSSKAAFGQVLTAEESAEVSAYTVRHTDVRVWQTHTHLSASIAAANGMALLSTGATDQAFAQMNTVAEVSYEPGLGVSCKWTSMYPTGGVADSKQCAGPFHEESGFWVGYNGTAFGWMHFYGYRQEIEALTIGTPSSGSENATITLNGSAHTVPLTAGTVEHNAREVAAYASGYADTGGTPHYDAWAVGAVVYFVREVSGVVAGAFTFSSGTAAGTFAQTQAGAVGTDNWTAIEDFATDQLGNGPENPSGMTLAPTNLNIWLIVYGWLGSLPPQLYVGADDCQRFQLCHTLPWTNQHAIPWASDPRYPMAYRAESEGSTTDIQVSGASVNASLQGQPTLLGPLFSHFVRTLAVGTTEKPCGAIMCAPVDIALGVINRRRMLLDEIVIANVGSKDAEVKIYAGPPSGLTGYLFTSPNSNSPMWKDSASTAVDASAPDAIRTIPLAAGETFSVRGIPGQELPIRAGVAVWVSAAVSASTTEITVGFNGREDL